MSAATRLKLDPADPAVRRVVYSAYRDLLCGYNEKANVLLSAMPASRVSEDRGIAHRVQSMARQSSQLSSDGSPGAGAPTGDEVSAPPAPPPPPPFPGTATAPTTGAQPPPPPPPPPPGHGRLPAVRLNTEPQEPPAAIQNAMMTKDKKPFTYTPGGLDLSQIRSPRMARRIVRNAANEGVGGENTPKPSPLAQGNGAPLPPSALAAMQPALPVAVFPPAGPPPAAPPQPRQQPRAAAPPPSPPSPPQPMQPTPASPPVNAAVASPASPPPPPAMQSPPPQRPNEPGSIYVPPVAPPPERRSQVGSLYIPPVTQQQQMPQPAVMSPGPMSPLTLNKAPTPWLTQRQQQTQPTVPPWAQQRQAVQRTPPTQQQQQQELPPQPQPQQQQQQQQQQRPPAQQQQQAPGTRIIPIQIEGREPPRAAAPSPQPYNRPQPFQQQPPPPQQQQTAPQAASLPPGTRIIPIQMEEPAPPRPQQHSPQQNVQQRKPVYVHNKFNPQQPTTPTPDSGPSPSPGQLQHQHSWGAQSPAPIQSRSFRVLQKITDTDKTDDDQTQQNQWSPQSTQNVPVHELRKLQLSEDDRALMNKFKAQVSEEPRIDEEENPRYRGGHIPSRVFRMLDESVDEDSFLHNESDPRYRGPSIPSRAFRMLQTMTDGAGADQHQVPQGGMPMQGPQMHMQHQTSSDKSPQPYIPPSEQQVPEPRKYVGGSIPSRSFRMLQAMTASPDNCDPGVSEL